MKIFLLICLASSLASSEKLDRSYLPPPGSKFSGGSPGDIQVPLEFPKESYSTGRPQVDGKPDIEHGIGINRRPAPTGAPGYRKPGSNFPNSFPKTTTSYAITQTTTFDPADDYEGLDQTGFVNGSTGIQPGFNHQQPIRGPGQGPSNQYRPGQSTVSPYGATSGPLFPGLQKGLEYLPPAPTPGNRGQSPAKPGSDQGGFGYPPGQPQGSKFQNGQVPTSGPTIYRAGNAFPGYDQQNQYISNQFPSSTSAPQYQDGRFGPTGPEVQQNQNQFLGNQFPTSTSAPQYQAGQRLTTPESSQQNQFLGNQGFPSSNTVPQFQTGQQFTTPGLNQQEFRARIPNQQNQYTRNQYQGNQNLPSSTAAPTPGQFPGNPNFPSTAVPNYQTGQRFTTPGQYPGELIPNQENFGSRIPSQQNQGQNSDQIFPSSTSASQFQDAQLFPTPGSQLNQQYPESQGVSSSTAAPQFQDGERFNNPSYIQEDYRSPVTNQQNQYLDNQNFPSSASAPQYQNNKKYATSGPIQQYPGNQNVPSSAAPVYQNGQLYTTPTQYQGELISEQQNPSQVNQAQYVGNQNFPSSTATPQYQDSQRFTTPGSQQRFESPQFNQLNPYPGSQTISSSTAVPQYQGQRYSTPGQLVSNQPSYPTSTVAPQYQQTFSSTPAINEQGFVPNQQNQYQQPSYNQQIPSSTATPGKFVPGSQAYGNDANQSTPGTAVSFPAPEGGITEGQAITTYGNTLPISQTEAGSSVYGTTPSVPTRFPNERFPSLVGSIPARDFSSTQGNFGANRPERPQADGDRNAEILNYENVLTPEGYFYSYDTSNGIHADETGTVGNGTRAQGSFSYTGDDGKVYSVFYSADENGFQPRGDHLPTPPPIPEAIQRVIDQANKDKESGIEDDDGSYKEDKYGYMKYEGPLTQFKSKNRTVPATDVSGTPNKTRSRIGGENKKISKPKGNNLSSEEYSEKENPEEFDSDLEKYNKKEVSRAGNENFDDKKETNRRVGTKQTKPIKNLIVEDNRPNRLRGNKIPIKSNFDKKSSTGRPITEDDKEVVSDDEVATDDDVFVTDISQEEDDDNTQGFDYDLVNYKDDPNNRTDFNGSNKYLPKSKGMNKKNISGKNRRPTMQFDSTKRPVSGVSDGKKPGDRASQPSQEIETDFIDGTRTRIPSRSNKFGQKVKDQSKATEIPAALDSDDEARDKYGNADVDTNDEYALDDDKTQEEVNRMKKPGNAQMNKKVTGKPKRPTVNERTDINSNRDNFPPSSGDADVDTYDEYALENGNRQEGANRMNKPGTSQLNKKVTGKPKRPTVNDRTGLYNNRDNISPSGEENGYEYTPPQRKFELEGAPKFPLQKEAQTTLRPFMTKNVYGDDSDPTDEDIDEGTVKSGRHRRPMTSQRYPGFKQNGDNYNAKPNEMNGPQIYTTTGKPVGSFGTTPSRRPYGRPTTAMPQYDGQRVSDKYNEPVTIQGTQKPGDIFYNTNAPNRGSSQTEGNVFSPTTPLPSSPSFFKQGPRYQGRPSDGTYYEETASPNRETYVNGPGSRPIQGQVPSTTYRPNYSFGDRTPSGSITVDGFGRPIPSTNAPFDKTLRPTYSTVRPDERFNGRPNSMGDFKPNEQRFGVTSEGTPGYQSSTSALIGEDFSGPKQPQRFDPQTGYYYK